MDGDPMESVRPIPELLEHLQRRPLVVSTKDAILAMDDAMSILRSRTVDEGPLDSRSWLMGAVYACLYLVAERELSPGDQLRLYEAEGVAR